jgi:RNA polymerase sigma-70 factor, ECF subfamily
MAFAHRRGRPSEAVVPQDWWVVLEAMAHLCPQHRAVILRSYYLGWTTPQIATDMQTTEGVVHCRLHVALRALKAEIQSRGDLFPAG